MTLIAFGLLGTAVIAAAFVTVIVLLIRDR
jgi:hypothetical protein